MKPRMCIFYIGVNYNPEDVSGDGNCLDAHDDKGNALKCKDVIAAGKCSRKRSSPVL